MPKIICKEWAYGRFNRATEARVNNGPNRRAALYMCVAETTEARPPRPMFVALDPSPEFISGAERVKSGNRGRPFVVIPQEQLKQLTRKGFTARQMACLFRCSTSTVYKLCYENNIKMKDRYSNISDDELKTMVSRLHDQHPNSGSQMMVGYLRANGIVVPRKRVRQMLQTVDPVGTGRRWGITVARRTYSVPCPNSVWHIDAHQKLSRWGFHTHGCIDGFSRLLPYLACETSCEASTVLKHFVIAAKKFGVPSRVRSDYGGENVEVALLMNILRGITRASHITGESVHNERIERLWRDVHKDVTSLFYEELYSLEDDGKLDPESEVERFAVQFVYLPIINEHLDSFRNGWNCHAVRTENHKTPEQLWFEGVLKQADTSNTALNELFDNHDTLDNRIMESIPSVSEHYEDSGNVSACLDLTVEQINHLEEVVRYTEGRTDKFIKCVAALKEMFRNLTNSSD